MDDFRSEDCLLHDSLVCLEDVPVDPIRSKGDLSLDQVSCHIDLSFGTNYTDSDSQVAIHMDLNKPIFEIGNNDISIHDDHSLSSDEINVISQSAVLHNNLLTSTVNKSKLEKPDVNSKEINNLETDSIGFIIKSICDISSLNKCNCNLNSAYNSCNSSTCEKSYSPGRRKDKCFVTSAISNFDSVVLSATHVKSVTESELSSSNRIHPVLSNPNSITKTLRNIKRLPSSIIADKALKNDSKNTLSQPDSSAFSCKVLLDTSGRFKEDVNCKDSVGKIISGDETVKDMLEKQNFSALKEFICSECGKDFRQKSHLVTHFRAHSNERRFKCSKCLLSFKTEVNLRFHLRSHTEALLKCGHCSKLFSTRRVLNRHIRLVHSSENFECEQCGKKFKTRKNLIHHYGIHSGVRPFSCKTCSKSFLHRSSLNTHMREHLLITSCSKGCFLVNKDSEKQNLKDKSSIENVNEKISCECLCTVSCCRIQENGKVVSCRHLQKPFICSICEKPFKLKSSLIVHIKTHSPSAQFKCPECEKVFAKKVSFEVHLKQHRGERPEFMCDQCCQSYHTQFSLKRHYLKHTSGKNFYCQLCDKKFWMKDALLVHVRSHANEKNFKCGLCNKNFSHKSSLVTHSRSFHQKTITI